LLLAALSANRTNASGYRSLYLLETETGGYYYCDAVTCELAPYFSEVCPNEGSYGSGLDCRPCLPGGTCPGGPRLWALPGFYKAQDEFAYVEPVRCMKPAEQRCLGGRFSPCGKGYTGERCARCAQFYFSESGYCRDCRSEESRNELTSVLSLAFSSAVVVALALAFFSERYVNLSLVFLMSVQELSLLLWSVSPYFREAVVDRLRVFKGIAFSYNFARPECNVGKELSGLEYYGYTLLLLLLMYGFEACAALLYQWRHREGPQEDWVRSPSKPRLVRAAIAVYTITYMELAVRTIRLMRCIEVDQADGSSVHVLQFDQATQCFTTAHTALYVWSWVVLLAYLVCIPLSLFYIIHKNASVIDAALEVTGSSGVSLDAPEVAYKKEVLLQGQRFDYHWGFLYRGLKSDYYFTRYCAWCGASVVSGLCYRAAAAAHVSVLEDQRPV